MKVFPFGFSLAHSALLLVYLGSHSRVRAGTSSSALWPACSGVSEFIGDGLCNEPNNNEGCGYDGGDCCLCTCVDGDHLCGVKAYDCQDPTAPDACGNGTSSSTPTLISTDTSQNQYADCDSVIGYVPYIGDGYCDSQNNNEECGYDGGDCCFCTCEDYFSCGIVGFDCQDPSAACMNASMLIPSTTSTPYSDGEYPNCTDVGGFPPFAGDGLCDVSNNKAECDYDGGDCCPCTCADGTYSCGVNGYDCQDPALPAPCANETSSSISTPGDDYYYYDNNYPNCTGYWNYIGDGWCDPSNNNDGCEYDGGDCCVCTCRGEYYTCGIAGYICQDPAASPACVNASDSLPPNYYNYYYYYSSYDDSEYPNCTSVGGYVPYISDGWCDAGNNNEECAYDGGDCCSCTCESGYYTCGVIGFDCEDPTVSTDCLSSSSVTPPYYDELYPNCTVVGGFLGWTSDGFCDPGNNNEECAYDGGDCCSCTCEDGRYSCGDRGFDCQDPTVPSLCADESSSNAFLAGYLDCPGSVSDVGNGHCDTENNNEECGYDGGDCCSCTCTDSAFYTCDEYDCQDPGANCSTNMEVVRVAFGMSIGVAMLMLCGCSLSRIAGRGQACRRGYSQTRRPPEALQVNVGEIQVATDVGVETQRA